MRKPGAYTVYLSLEGLSAMIFALIFTFDLVYQVQVAHLSPVQLVLVGTILESTIFLLEVPTGVVADVRSRRLSVIIGIFLIGAGFLLEGSIPRFWAIILAQVLWGAGYTFTSGATQAWISDEIGEARAGQAFLRGSQAGQIGSLIGLLASMVLVNVSVNLPILAGGGMFLLLGVFLVVAMPEEGFHPTPPAERETWKHMTATLRSGLHMVRLRPVLLYILGIGLFYGLYSEAYDRLWVKLILDNYTLPGLGPLDPVLWFGLLRLGSLGLSAAATEVVRRRVDTNSHVATARSLMGFTLGLITGLLIFALSRAFWVAVAAFALISVTRTLIGPIYSAWVNQRLDSRVRATVLSMSSQVDAIGQIAGGPPLALVGSLVSVRVAIVASSAVLTPVLFLYRRVLRQNGELAPDFEPVK